ncbi:MAG: acetyl-CoA acetyltransferase [Proteobacteria bacterium ST_bin15]|nr:MAG: acetyl-CoA acetyltransferase [Proteobacteria bacterium ST_bin15]
MMSKTQDVVILSGVRTGIGTFAGSLKDSPPTQLGALVTREALQRADVKPETVGHVVFGNVIHTEPKDMYQARVAAMEGGIPQEVPALTLNRLCGSGVQAIISAAQTIMLEDAEVAVAGGVETMSRAPFAAPWLRQGQRMGDTKFVDMMLGALHDPFGHGHMGVTAENVAARWQISRADQDAFALESQRRAAHAIKEGRFKEQIIAVKVKKGRDMVDFASDEHVKGDTTADILAGLKPVFSKEGSVTAGNASGINDGAAALVLMSGKRAEADKRKPMARIVGYGHAGVAPEVMGIGPVDAVRSLMHKTGLTIKDFDVIESNEAFASQACAVSRELGFPADKVNVNGGAIALGHPIGATGAVITIKAMYELKRINGRYGLITMCIGGGQGIALAIENIH